MRTLKKSIWSYMYKVTFALVSVILISITALNIANEQSRAQGTADKIFEQMDKMLEARSFPEPIPSIMVIALTPGSR